jgi:hypothetical protein
VARLATLLAGQGGVFLWLTGRAAEFRRTPQEYAQTIAADLASALVDDPTLDIERYLNDRYQTTYRPFAVVTRDGRLVQSRRVAPPFDLSRAALARLTGPRTAEAGLGPPRSGAPGGRGAGAADPPGAGASPGPSSGADSGRGGGRGGRGREGFGRGRGQGPALGAIFAPVVIAGETFGLVAVTAQPRPLSAAVRDLGPMLGIVAIGLLALGTAIGALLIFRPTHRRLHALQQAARAIGEGQTGVRATAIGGDEVAMLARTFNEMAGGLEERTQALGAVLGGGERDRLPWNGAEPDHRERRTTAAPERDPRRADLAVGCEDREKPPLLQQARGHRC